MGLSLNEGSMLSSVNRKKKKSPKCLWPVNLKFMYFTNIMNCLTDMVFPVLKRNSKFTLLTLEGVGGVIYPEKSVWSLEYIIHSGSAASLLSLCGMVSSGLLGPYSIKAGKRIS